ncbi:MAG: OmpA family protein [Pseudomonadota bacterium]|nr:OmpA family protein [Pseudomonadota bacterium]
MRILLSTSCRTAILRSRIRLFALASAAAVFAATSPILAQSPLDSDNVTIDLSVIADRSIGGTYLSPSALPGVLLQLPPRTNPISTLHVMPKSRISLTARATAMPKPVPEKKAKKKVKPKVASAPATPKPSASPVPKVTEVSEALPPLPPKAAPKLAEPKAAEAPPAVTEQSAVPAAAEIRPGRAIRVEFGAAESKLPPTAKDALTSLATAIKNDENLRLQLMAYAGGNELSASKARRLSLSRALSVRSFLIEKGVRSTRVDVRALGNKTTDKPINRVDVNVTER